MNTNAITPEKLALLVELLPSADSLRDIALMLGVPQRSVSQAAAPFIAIMTLSGTMPKCGCGKDKFHPYGCVSNAKKSYRKELLVGRDYSTTAVLIAKRQAILDAIMTGETFKQIEQQFGMSKKSAPKYLRFLTPEQREERKRLEGVRSDAKHDACRVARVARAPEIRARARAREAVRRTPEYMAARNSKRRTPESREARNAQRQLPAIRAARNAAAKCKRDAAKQAQQSEATPIRDELYLRIAAAVPRWPSPALRDDIISDVYLAVTSGELAADQVEAQTGRYAKRAANDLESRFGPVSLDEPCAGTTLTRLDLLADEAAAETAVDLSMLRIGQSVRSPHRRSIHPFNQEIAA